MAMATSSQSHHSLRLQRTSYKSHDLIYAEPGYQLVIDLESCCEGTEYYLGGTYGSFATWTVPAGEPISQEKRDQIIERIYAWSRAKKTPVDIGPALTREEILANDARHGYNTLHVSENCEVAYPSNSVPPVVIKAEEVEAYKARDWRVQPVPDVSDTYIAFPPDTNASSKPGGLFTRLMIWLNSRS